MRVTLRDSEVLLAIPPLEAAAYLRANGWREVHTVPDIMSIWVIDQDPNRGPEILLPLNRHLRDYALRMSEMLTVLEKFENRSQLDILRDVLNTTGDVIRIRLERNDGKDGSVPLDAGVGLVQGAREMFVAAACSTLSPKPFFPNRPPGEVSTYLKKVRLGQTEQGSYIVTVVSRVTPVLQPAFDEPVAEPFERRVVLTLAAGLEATKAAADMAASQGDSVAFRNAVPVGVSANLCDALTEMSGDDANANLDVSFSWSPARPLPARGVNRVSFSSDRFPFIHAGAKVLRTAAPLEDVEIVGGVTRLEREARSGPGSIMIYTIFGGKARHVHVFLREDEYERAAQAHVDGHSVVCRGNLVPLGKAYALEQPHGFRTDFGGEE